MCMHVCAGGFVCMDGLQNALNTNSSAVPYLEKKTLWKRREGLVGENNSERDRLEMRTINSKKRE